MTFREDNINVNWRRLPLARDLAIDNSMLSERGRGQAKECAARTIQTASIIAAEKNLLVKVCFPRKNNVNQFDNLLQPEPGLCEALHHCCDPPAFWTPEKLKEKYPLVDTKYIPVVPRTSLPKQEFGDNACKPRIRVTLNRLTEKYEGETLFDQYDFYVLLLALPFVNVHF
ncbi:hypothetical protein ANCDUO_16794 [Ancylostoma duodenale]|uniref:Uncharacterized protein n=1 Tax=Ancylostoma duodenale TaxID=51022 RepID=A0A0C2C9V8_9BILA|nr:hypothetical protein ANCDUO_16794 [Ancylostoma duodenale]